MGQKTHPTGFRVGIIKPWLSTWYAKVKDYAGFVAEDAKIRKYTKISNFFLKYYIFYTGYKKIPYFQIF